MLRVVHYSCNPYHVTLFPQPLRDSNSTKNICSFDAYRLCKKPFLKLHAQLSSGVRGVTFGLSLRMRKSSAYACSETRDAQVCISFGSAARPRGYKTLTMLNSAEHEIYPAHKCQNANYCWHFNIYKHDKYNI